MNKIISILALCIASYIQCMAQIYSTVLLDQTDVVRADNHVETNYKRVVKILNKHSDDEANFNCIIQENEKLKDFSGSITDINGKVLTKFKKADLQTSEVSSSLATDVKMMFISYTPPTYPIIVNYQWTIRTDDNIISYPTFQPQQDTNQDVVSATYRISTPSTSPYRLHSENICVKPIVREENGVTTTEFSVNNLQAIKDEELAPSISDLLPRVLVQPCDFVYYGTTGSLRSWHDFGKWEFGLIAGRDVLPESQKLIVKNIVAGCTDDYQKVDRLYRYLYENTRYVSIQLGIGGYQPFPAERVVQTGFGDCKALSNYMCAMLREAGIEAFYANVGTRTKKLYEDFPNFSQFNHAIAGAKIGNDTLWLECTNASMPAGYVYERLCGHEILIVNSDGGHIVELPVRNDTLNIQRNIVHVELANNGNAHLYLTQNSECSAAESMIALTKMNDEDKSKYIKTLVSTTGTTLSKYDIKKDFSNRMRPRVSLTAEMECDQYATKLGNRLIVPVNVIRDIHKRNDKKRTLPLCIDRGCKDEDSVTIIVPNDYQVERLPKDVSINNDFGTFKMVYTLNDDGKEINVHMSMILHKGTYPQTKYPDFCEFINEVSELYECNIFLTKGESTLSN